MIHKLYKTTKEGEKVYHMTLDSGDTMEDLLKFLFPGSEIKMIEDCPEAPHYSQYPYCMATIGDVVVAFNQPALGTNLNSLKLRNRILNAESKSITQYKRMLELESFFDKLDVDPYFSFVGKQIRVRIICGLIILELVQLILLDGNMMGASLKDLSLKMSIVFLQQMAIY